MNKFVFVFIFFFSKRRLCAGCLGFSLSFFHSFVCSFIHFVLNKVKITQHNASSFHSIGGIFVSLVSLPSFRIGRQQPMSSSINFLYGQWLCVCKGAYVTAYRTFETIECVFKQHADFNIKIQNDVCRSSRYFPTIHFSINRFFFDIPFSFYSYTLYVGLS